MAATVDRDLRSDVSELLVRYATAIDRRDWTLFRTCFTDDVEADYGDIGVWHGIDEITAFMDETHAACGHTMHRITNQAVAGNGNGVSARSYVDAIVMGADNLAGVRAVGFYDDDLVDSGAGWKIARRRFTMVFFEPVRAGGG
jgi:3-phenylpropionate/cinnamic acid dioxygenase small subunit